MSKTVDKDKMRCHYCNEFGHFIREYSKRSRDEEEAQCFSGMNSGYYENDGYTDVFEFREFVHHSDMYELFRFMYKYIWQVQKGESKK